MGNVLLVLAFLATAPDEKLNDIPKKLGAAVEIGDLSGFYTVKGLEVGGKKYSGIVAVVKQADVYVFQWTLLGGSTFVGIGVRQGETVAVAWATPSEKGVVKGVNVYRIGGAPEAPRLSGRWASLPGTGVLQTENLFWLKAFDSDD